MDWDHAPRALHHHLHQESADREPDRARGKSPERQHDERQRHSDNDDPPPPEAFGQRAERYAADDSADIVYDCDQADLMRGKAMLDLQESRVEILRPMTEEIEGSHQQDGIDAETPVRLQDGHCVAAGGRGGPTGRFRDAAADIENEKRRNNSNHEHAAPSDILKEQAVDDRGQKISGRVARLQQARHKASSVRRYGLHGERRTDTPFPAHRNAEDSAEHEQDGETWREARRKLDNRI